MKNWVINTLVGAVFVLLTVDAVAQNLSSERGHGAIGIGLGIPYGGIGARMNYNLMAHTTLFGGVGYNLADVGYNLGMRFVIPSNRQTEFYLVGMYGTNASIRIEGDSDANQSYYGPSLGVGVQINSLGREGNYWDLGLVLPFRSSSYDRDLDNLKNYYYDIIEPWPVLISVGYNIHLF